MQTYLVELISDLDEQVSVYVEAYDESEVEPSLGDVNITLDSYIVSNTEYKDVSFWAPRPDFKKNHVIFQADSAYVDELFSMILT